MIKSNILDDFLDYLSSSKGHSENTIKEYYYDLRIFLRYMIIRKTNFYDNVKSLDEVDIDKVDEDLLKAINKQDIYAYISYLDK